MNEYYEIHVSETGAALFSADYCRMDDIKETFPTREDALAWIKERYGKARRSRMYCDTTDGESKEIGWIYRFRDSDWSHMPVKLWNRMDWVSLFKCQCEIAEIS